VPCQTLTLAISTCSLRSSQIFSISFNLPLYCSRPANDSQYINVFLCLPLALLPSIIPETKRENTVCSYSRSYHSRIVVVTSALTLRSLRYRNISDLQVGLQRRWVWQNAVGHMYWRSPQFRIAVIKRPNRSEHRQLSEMVL